MYRSVFRLSPRVAAALLSVLLASGFTARSAAAQDALLNGNLPNNFPFLNKAGTAATFSTAGFVDLGNPFHVPQGTNGRRASSAWAC